MTETPEPERYDICGAQWRYIDGTFGPTCVKRRDHGGKFHENENGEVWSEAGQVAELESKTAIDTEELRILRAIHGAAEKIYDRLSTGNADEVALSFLLEEYSQWKIG